MNLDNQSITSALAAYAFVPNSWQCDQIRTYIGLLLRWNQKISLTTVVEPDKILKFHFGESVYAISAVPIKHGRLADVGSGAGFPGLALALALPDLSVTLIESNTKKSVFLSEVVRELKLDRVQVQHVRMEKVRFDTAPPDFITARAVGRHDELLKWALGSLNSGGQLVLWLGDEGIELISCRDYLAWQSPTLIPGSKGRLILAGRKS